MNRNPDEWPVLAVAGVLVIGYLWYKLWRNT